MTSIEVVTVEVVTVEVVTVEIVAVELIDRDKIEIEFLRVIPSLVHAHFSQVQASQSHSDRSEFTLYGIDYHRSRLDGCGRFIGIREGVGG